jgi:NAD(P)-dependent dehydrogenase (short-subunit alcohol dehydrogenase family)
MRDLAKKAALEQSLKKAGLAERVTFLQLDVSDRQSFGSAVDTVLAATGNTLDAVVHNAGVAAAGAYEEIPEAEIRRVMETNFFGVLELTRLLLPTFRAQNRGRIVVVSSQAAFAGQPANSIYCASKWAVEGWAESVAYELDPFGIEVVLIEPGPYRTEIWKTTPRFRPQGSDYLAWVRRVYHAADKHEKTTARDPKEVAIVIAKALEARRPRFRYPVGLFAHIDLFFRGKLPTRLKRYATALYLGLPLPR